MILLTAWTHLESAVQLVKAGAADYLAKPWDNDKLLATVENLLELSEATRERRCCRRSSASGANAWHSSTTCAASCSHPMRWSVRSSSPAVSRARMPVLITGPNGAGKERIAEIVHANSAVGKGPFVAINCGAIPAELIEAELFGAEAGAYTGATRARVGRFELANGGTLFLDEIGNLPLAGQMKLLRVLETGEFERSARARRVPRGARGQRDQRRSRALIRDGRFREDLYYRLNVIEIALPPLAERRDDILPLARHFLGSSWRLSEDAEAALLAHDWPGNVRELRNSIERASCWRARAASRPRISICPRRIAARPTAIRTGAAPSRRVDRDVEQPSRELIEASLREAGGNISRAAQSLGLSRQALYRRMERFNSAALSRRALCEPADSVDAVLARGGGGRGGGRRMARAGAAQPVARDGSGRRSSRRPWCSGWRRA